MDWSATWLGIANRALSRINKQVLQTLDDGSTSAMLCNQLIPSVTKSILEQCGWKSARKRAVIAPQLSGPAFGFRNRFAIPVDCVRLTDVYSDLPWKREGGYILSDEDVMRISYVAIPAVPDELGSLIVDAITSQLAAELSVSLTADSTITNLLYQEAEIKIQKARLQESAAERDIKPDLRSWSDAASGVEDSAYRRSELGLLRQMFGERDS